MTAAKPKPKRTFPVEPLTPREVARLLRQCSTGAAGAFASGDDGHVSAACGAGGGD